jgi:hypothetical protein
VIVTSSQVLEPFTTGTLSVAKTIARPVLVNPFRLAQTSVESWYGFAAVPVPDTVIEVLAATTAQLQVEEHEEQAMSLA